MLTTAQIPALDLTAAPDFARETGLRYVRDDEPGFSRRRAGKGFTYLDHQNCRISNDDVLERIRALVLPPAWDSVWICRFQNGHLQATGRDARERKQYRYHTRWTTARNENKFGKLKLFGEALPELRRQVMSDLKIKGMSRDKVLAGVVQVMELTQMRVGNDEYAEENNSYGLTTLLNRHAKVRGQEVHFKFRGKSGVEHDVTFEDPVLSKIVRRCQELPGQELFAYLDDEGEAHDIGSADVNEYLRRATGECITAKDFRTWGGTRKAIEILTQTGPLDDEASERAHKIREVGVIKDTAAHLGNTVAVCRKYYVHPLVFEADREGRLHDLHRAEKKKRSSKSSPKGRSAELSVEERVLMKLLS